MKEDEIGMGHRGIRFPSSGARRKFLLKKQTNGTSARRKGQATAEWPAAKAGDQLSVRCGIKTALLSRRSSTEGSKRVSQQHRWTLLRDKERKAGSILVIDSDITEKKQFEEQFLRAQRLESIGQL